MKTAAYAFGVLGCLYWLPETPWASLVIGMMTFAPITHRRNNPLSPMTLHSIPPHAPSLRELANGWRKRLNESDAGPVLIALEVMKLSARWESHRVEAGGLSCSTWLRRELGPGRGLPFFRKRAEAVARLGGQFAARLNHGCAVWIYQNVPDQLLSPLMTEISKLYRQQGSVCVTLVQARRVYYDLAKIRPRKKKCARCELLEAQLRKLGVDPDS